MNQKDDNKFEYFETLYTRNKYIDQFFQKLLRNENQTKRVEGNEICQIYEEKALSCDPLDEKMCEIIGERVLINDFNTEWQAN